LSRDDDAEFMWTNAEDGTFDEAEVGEYDVSAELDSVESDLTTVTVEAADVAEVEIEPETDQTITAGDTVEFEATALDAFDNIVEDDDSEFDWTNADNGTFDETAVGEYAVSAERDGVESDSVTVIVDPAEVETVEIEPADNQTITAGETVGFDATAIDEFDNIVVADDSAFGWENATDDGTFEQTDADSYTVTAEIDGVNSPTVTVTVQETPTAFLSTLDIAGQGDDASITESDSEDITVDVENVGDQAGSFTIEMDIGDGAVQSSETTDELDAGESETVTFESVTGSLAPDEYSVSVTAAESDLAGTLTVESERESDPDPTPTPDPAAFLVSELDTAPATPTPGGEVQMTVAVTNDGGSADSQELTFVFDGVEEQTKTVSLSGDDSETVSFTRESPAEPGTYELRVLSDDDDVSTTVAVQEPTDQSVFDLSEQTIEPETPHTGEEMAVTTTVTNIGDDGGETNVSVLLDGEQEVTKPVTLDATANETVTLPVTAPAESGTTNLTTTTPDSTVSTNVTVTDAIPAAFEITDVTVTPTTVSEPGESAELSVTVANTGEETATKPVSYELPDEGGSEELTLEGGDDETVTFDLDTSELAVDQPVSVTVETDNDETSQQLSVTTEDADDDGAGFGITAGVLALIAVLLAARARNDSP